MDETQPLPMSGLLAGTTASGGGGAAIGGAHGAHTAGRRRPRTAGKLRASDVLGVVEDDDDGNNDAYHVGKWRAPRTAIAVSSGSASASGSSGGNRDYHALDATPLLPGGKRRRLDQQGRSSREADTAALAAALAAQPRTLKLSDPLLDDVDNDEDESQSTGDAGPLLLGVESESNGRTPPGRRCGKDGDTNATTPTTTTAVSAAPSSMGPRTVIGESPLDCGESGHGGGGGGLSLSTQTITAAPMTKVTSGRPLPGFTVAIAGAHDSTSNMTKVYASSSGSSTSINGGSGSGGKTSGGEGDGMWAALLRGHQANPTVDTFNIAATGAHNIKKTASKASIPHGRPSPSSSSTTTSCAAAAVTEAFIESVSRTVTQADVAPPSLSSSSAVAARRTPRRQAPQRRQRYGNDDDAGSDSPAIIAIPAARRPTASPLVGCSGGGGGALIADGLSLAATFVTPTESPTAATDGAQTLCMHDLSLRPETCESAGGGGAESDPSGLQLLGAEHASGSDVAETLDDGYYKGVGMGAPDSKHNKVNDNGNEDEDDIQDAGRRSAAAAEDHDDVDNDETQSDTPLFGPRAARQSPKRRAGETRKAAAVTVTSVSSSVSATPVPRDRTTATTTHSNSTSSGSRKSKNTPSKAATQHRAPLAVGVAVEARWCGGRWFAATTTEAEAKGYLQVQWEADGGRMHLKVGEVRLPKVSVSRAAAAAGAAATKATETDATPPKTKKDLRLPTGGGASNSGSSGSAPVEAVAGSRASVRKAKDVSPATRDSPSSAATLSNAATAPTENNEEPSSAATAGTLSNDGRVMTATQLVQLMEAEDEMEALIYAPAEEEQRHQQQQQQQQQPSAAITVLRYMVAHGIGNGGGGGESRGDSQAPLITAISPEWNPFVVPTQLLDSDSDHDDHRQGGIGNGSDPASDEFRRPRVPTHHKKGSPSPAKRRAHPHPGEQVTAMARRRLALSATPIAGSSRPSTSDPSGGGGGSDNTTSTNNGHNRATPAAPAIPEGRDPHHHHHHHGDAGLIHASVAYPDVAVGEDYYFCMPANPPPQQPSPHPRTSSPPPPLAPTVVLGRVIAAEEATGASGGGGGGAEVASPTRTTFATAAHVPRRVLLQLYERRHVTMRQNPRTGELEQQTSVYLGPQQAIVPVGALLFDTPVFVLTPAALRHVYTLEEDGGDQHTLTGGHNHYQSYQHHQQRREGARETQRIDAAPIGYGGGGDPHGGRSPGDETFDNEHSPRSLFSSPLSASSSPPLPSSSSTDSYPGPESEGGEEDRGMETRTAVRSKLYGNMFPLPKA